MSSTINASNSGFGGIVSTGDSSGVLQLQTTGTTAITVDTSQNTTLAGKLTTASTGIQFSDASTQTAAASPYVLKNRIINGDMQVWQRGTSFTVGLSTYTYTADRFKNFSANTSTTVSRSTSVPTTAGSLFQYSFKLQRPNGNTGTNSLSINQIIETANCYDLAGQSVTLSFWVKKGANYSGGNIAVQILTGTVADQGGDPYAWTGLATAVNDSTYAPTTSWARVTYTGTVASNALEVCPVIAFTPTGTAGADDSLYITGVQLEIGSTATPFERRLYNQELANCQRYYNKWSGANSPNVGLTTCLANGGTSPGIRRASWANPVDFRSAPTLSLGGTIQLYTSGLSNLGFVSFNGATPSKNIISFDINTTNSGTAGQGIMMIIDSSSAANYIDASAEL